jgi:hypothetical protein
MLTKPRSTSTSSAPLYIRKRRRGPSPLMLIGISVPVLLALIGVGVLVVLPRINSHAAAAANPNCTIIVPPNPLSAQGLATPYQLFAPDAAANGPCNEANVNQTAFVQADIFDPATGQISTYDPLVIDQGTQPAVAPTAPNLPADAVVALWFGFNGTNLTLQAADNNTLAQAQCVNGLNGSVFTQFAYCNAPNFFGAVNQGIQMGKVQVPAPGTAKDGMPCPTVRDFSVVDQDQSDNVQTMYLANGNGQIAQDTAANQAQIQNATVLANPSDNLLLSNFIDPALGCTPWKIPDLANNNNPLPTLATDELQAAQFQQAPIALVPLNDPMTLVNGQQSQDKTILYRKGVDQNPGGILPSDPTTYCQNLVNTGLPRIKNDMNLTANFTSPAPAAANNLFNFLAMRFNQSYTNLGCQNLLNQPNPVTLQMDGNGVVISATITLPGTAGGTGVTQAATGNAQITLNPQAGNANMAVNVTYANHANQQINVNIATNSCTGTAIFTQAENTNGQGMVQANTVINNLQGTQAIPNNWFFTVTDPAQNNAVVGCGSVTSNGTTGTATLGTVAGTTGTGTTTPTSTPTMGTGTGTTTGTPMPTPTITTPQNTGGGHHHHHW